MDNWELGKPLVRVMVIKKNRDRKSFTQIVASGVVNLVAGNINAMFIKEDGSLWGMGHGNNGKWVKELVIIM